MIKNKDKGDAIIDFLTWAPDSDVMEFNVFKYARAEYGPGLVALQYAQRFKLGDMSVEQFRALRAACRQGDGRDRHRAGAHLFRGEGQGAAGLRAGMLAPDADEAAEDR